MTRLVGLESEGKRSKLSRNESTNALIEVTIRTVSIPFKFGSTLYANLSLL